MAGIKYINNSKENGIKHDYDGAIKYWNKLSKKKMGESYDSKYHFHNVNCMWQVYMSPRDMGKTTQVLGMILVLHKWDGLKGSYIRNRLEDIKENIVSGIFNTIVEYGYVEDIYGDEYNSIRYYRNKRAFYLVYVDENGKILREDPAELMHVHSLDYSPEATKSGYVSPSEDVFVVDEFIPMNGFTTENNFLALNHLLSTITRDRLPADCIRVYMLANTITANTHIFHELGIYTDVQQMKIPEGRLVINNHNNMPVWVEYISLHNGEQKKRRLDIMLSKFGFSNPKLSSITGDTKSEIKIYPHLPRIEEGEERYREPIYIYFVMYGRRFRLCIESSNLIGEYLYCFESYDTPKDDSIIYTLETPMKHNERYGLGRGDGLDKYITDMYKANRIYFSYNDVGSMLDTYIHEIRENSVLF